MCSLVNFYRFQVTNFYVVFARMQYVPEFYTGATKLTSFFQVIETYHFTVDLRPPNFEDKGSKNVGSPNFCNRMSYSDGKHVTASILPGIQLV
jgi:hypothetical protein